MNCLWLTRWPPYPPLNAGDVTCSRNLIEHLTRYARVDVLACETPGVSPREVANVSWHLVSVPHRTKVGSLFSTLPNVANRHHASSYLAALKELAPRADAIIVDHLAMAWCVQELKKIFGHGGPPVILINHDHEASMKRDLLRGIANPLMRAVIAWDAYKAGQLERSANIAADGYTAITSTDLASFQSEAPNTPGILSMPGYSGPKTLTRKITVDTPRRICVVGGRGPFHKQMILHQTLEALAARVFDDQIIIDVVGGGIEGQAALQSKYPRFNFLGFVDDLQAYFQTVRLGLIPDQFGGGFKVRALSHIFMRTPMLAVRQALAGMTLVDDVHFIAADTLDQALDRLPAVIDDIDRLNLIQDTAFSYCENAFDWDDRARDIFGFARELRERKGLQPNGDLSVAG